MEVDVIRVTTFDLKSEIDHSTFKQCHSEFLALLRHAYGERYYGDNNYLQKIKKRNMIVLLAIAIETGDIVGTLHYKHSGKMAGLAVLEEYRKREIATRLINQAKRNLHYLFAEVDERNTLIIKILKNNKFSPIDDYNIIEKNLKLEKDVVSIARVSSDGVVIYYHSKNKRKADKYKKFMMLHWSKMAE